jgi:FixJ family two-component response regulator
MSQANRRIAVVDDESSVRKALERLIRSAGMSVATYASGDEFLAAVALAVPDCVVLDLHMPGATGFAVQARLARLAIRVPVVVITGHDTPESRQRAVAGGAAAYLLKPVDERALLEAIVAAIEAQAPGPAPSGRGTGA